MYWTQKKVIPLSILLVSFCSSLPAQGQFDELAKKVPPSANAIILLDVQRLLSSPQGARENWKNKLEQAFATRLVSMSPDTQRLILAAQLDYEFMKPQWEFAIADLGKPRSAAEIARVTKGIADAFGDTLAVELRDQVHVVLLSPTRLAAMSPANRQFVSRWLNESKDRTTPGLSSYLRGTLTASQQSPLVIAFDLEDAIPPDVIRAKVASSPAIKEKGIDVEAATKALNGIRGLVLEVAVTEGSFGRFRAHFREDASILAPVAKQLLQEVLGDLGATLSDIEEWKVQVEPNRIGLNGALSEDGRRKILTLIDNPLSSMIAAETEATSPESTAKSPSDKRQSQAIVVASQQYYKEVASVVNDVLEESKHSKTLGQNAMWFDKWARRIERLPVLNVDADLLAFGRFVSEQLRNMSGALRGANIRTGAREAQVWGGAYSYGGYSYYSGWRDVENQRRAIGAEERAAGVTSARDAARQIESTLAKVRSDLSLKYKVEF